jgi:hypothetical protein
MEPNADQPEASESKSRPKPNAKDDLESQPLPKICQWKWCATNAGKPA